MKRGIVSLALMGHILVCDGFANSEQRILKVWETSSEYAKFIALGGENSPEAKQLRTDTITKYTKERLQIYLSMLEPAKRNVYEQSINKFSIAAQIFLCDLNQAVISEIGENEAKNITKDMYVFVQSVDKGTGKSIDLLNTLLNKYPQLRNNRVILDIYETGKISDLEKGGRKLIDLWKGLSSSP